MNRDKQIDAYIAAFPPPLRARLREMRRLIRRAAPQAREVFSNDMPGYFLYDSLVWFAGVGQEVAFYPRGYHFKKVYAKELAGFKTHKGAILLPVGEPLPAALIARIVKDRVKENQLAAKPTPVGIPKTIGAPALRALANAKITSLADLARYSEEEILELHGVGPRALPRLRAALKRAGLEFRRHGGDK